MVNGEEQSFHIQSLASVETHTNAEALENCIPRVGSKVGVCTFPLNRKSWLTCSSYFSMNVLYYHFKINEMIIDWSPFVIWSLFNLFKGFCIQKFTFLCIFFLCKNWCNMCIKHCMYYLYIVWQNDFFLSFGCINKSCCEVVLFTIVKSLSQTFTG